MNAKSSISFTLNGIIILFNLEHFLKALDLIEITEFGIEKSVKDEHPWNEYLSIETTEEGIEIFVNDEHFLKVFSLIVLIDDEFIIYDNK